MPIMIAAPAHQEPQQTTAPDTPLTIMNLLPYQREQVLRRQFPRRLRRRLRIRVRHWEDAIWAEIHLHKDANGAATWWGDLKEDFELLGACELLEKPRRFEYQKIFYATIDPALIAYALVRL